MKTLKHAREIKNISFVFEELAETILPQLRRSRLTANIEIIGKSDDEIMSFWKNNPDELNIEELMYAATLTENRTEQEKYTNISQQTTRKTIALGTILEQTSSAQENMTKQCKHTTVLCK